MSTVSLEVYVQEGCALCERASKLAAEMSRRFPQADVRVVEMGIDSGTYRHLVTATPTFVLNGGVFSLGNPNAARLGAAIEGLLAEGGEG